MINQNVKEVKLLHHTRYLTHGSTIVPALRIEGNQLLNYGFKPGDTVIVTFKKGRLTVKLKHDYTDAKKRARADIAENKKAEQKRLKEIASRPAYKD
jgi:hypothetical protein